MKTELIIDTSKTHEVAVTLVYGEKRFESILPSTVARAQTALPMIEKLVKQAEISVHDIREITVASGTESLTGVRVGFAIANIFGRFLDIPVNGKKAPVFPDYSGTQWDT